MTLLIALAFACLGALLASFTAVIAERIYTGQSWWKGRSRCNACGRELTALDLMPVLSWLGFFGRCRTCRARIPPTYTYFEIALALSFLLAYLRFGVSLTLPVFLVALAALGFIVNYDLRHTIVPVWSSTAFIVVGATVAVLEVVSLGAAAFGALLTVFGTAFIIALAFFLLYALSRGRAMGLGDAPVAFGLSLLAGNAAIPGVVFSFWIGAVIGIFILVFRRGGPTMRTEVPFVPFLALGFLLAIFTQWNPFML